MPRDKHAIVWVGGPVVVETATDAALLEFEDSAEIQQAPDVSISNA